MGDTKSKLKADEKPLPRSRPAPAKSHRDEHDSKSLYDDLWNSKHNRNADIDVLMELFQSMKFAEMKGHEGIFEEKEEEKLPTQNLVKWDEEVVGLKHAKSVIEYSFILPRRFPRFFRESRSFDEEKKIDDPLQLHRNAVKRNEIVRPRVILFWGPPGTGKTKLARAFAKIHGAEFEEIQPSNILSKFVGETPQKLNKIFTEAKTKKTIIFLDEFDSIARTRGENEMAHDRRMKTELLLNLEDFRKTCRADSAVIACVNNISELDEAVQRRFAMKVFCDLPVVEERLELFRFFTREIGTELADEQWQVLAEKTVLYSGSDIENLVTEATLQPAQDLQNATHFKQNSEGDWYVCEAGTDGAVEMSLSQLKKDSLAPRRDVSFTDFLKVLLKSSPTMTEAKYRHYQQQRRIQQYSDKRAPPTEQQSEMIQIFQSDNSIVAVPGQFETFKKLVMDPKTESYRRFHNILFLCSLVFTLLCVFLPKVLWFFLAVLAFLQLSDSVFLPIIAMLRTDKRHDMANLGQLLQICSMVVTLLVLLTNGSDLLNYSGWRLIDVLVLSWLMQVVNIFTSLLATFLTLKFSHERYSERYSFHFIRHLMDRFNSHDHNE